MNTATDTKNRTRVVITYRSGRVVHETHTEHAAYILCLTYNATAYAHGVTDVKVEWDDASDA